MILDGDFFGIGQRQCLRILRHARARGQGEEETI
jgi:hypothetical protein